MNAVFLLAWSLSPALLLCTSLSSSAAHAPTAAWPQFRGPAGNGHHQGQLPLHWAEATNVTWKTAIPGRGWASPVIWDDLVWCATATEDGHELSLLAVERESGNVRYDLRLFYVAAPQFCHRFNSYASPTPVIDADSIFVTFGSAGTACVETRTGRVLWERRDLPCNHFRGAGSSPILHQDLLILPFDGSDTQYIVALDKATGRTVWRSDRSLDFRDLDEHGQPAMEGDLRKAYATPHIAEFDGRPVLLSSGAQAHYAYEPRTGRELWRVEDRTAHSASTRPAVGLGLVFVPAGWPNGELLAIRPGQAGEVIDAHTSPAAQARLAVAWKTRRNVPNKPSVTVVGEWLFMIDDGGIASCLEAETGREIWRERVGGNYSASPIYAAGRLYLSSEEGKVTVLAAGPTFEILAENQLDDGFMASPAATGNALVLRSRTHLYRIDAPGSAE